MRIALSYFLLCITSVAFAQTKTIQLDTIHVRGYVYDEFGDPVKGVKVTSSRTYPKVEKGYAISAYDKDVFTDDNGYFKLNFAQFNDTIKLLNTTLYNIQRPIYNRGSRYLVIYLPPLQPIDDGTVPINAIRTHAQKKSVIKIVPLDTAFTGIYPEFLLHARFRGGIANFISTIQKNITYPQKAIDNNIEGEVKIIFTIEKDGSLADPKIFSGIGYGVDDAIISALKNSSKWVPAINLGKRIAEEHILAFRFTLSDK